MIAPRLLVISAIGMAYACRGQTILSDWSPFDDWAGPFVGGTNAWQLYHCRMGELHCGSEAERWLPASPPFWKREEFKGWPIEKKGTTP